MYHNPPPAPPPVNMLTEPVAPPPPTIAASPRPTGARADFPFLAMVRILQPHPNSRLEGDAAPLSWSAHSSLVVEYWSLLADALRPSTSVVAGELQHNPFLAVSLHVGTSLVAGNLRPCPSLAIA